MYNPQIQAAIMGPIEGCMETGWTGLPARKLFQAAHSGDISELRDLLSEPGYQKMVNDFDGDQCGILHVCALSGDDLFAEEIVELLVGAGIDVNRQSGTTKETALHYAVCAMRERLNYVRALLEHGARSDIPDWRGTTAMKRAVTKCSNQVLELLQATDEKMNLRRDLEVKANKYRNAGNKTFAQGKYEEAKEFYTLSIEALEDHRTFSNRALCSINMGQKILKDGPIDSYPLKVIELGLEAADDAEEAADLDPTFVKAYYRWAIGTAMARDIAGAEAHLEEGLEHNPENEQLAKLLQKLNDLNTPATDPDQLGEFHSYGAEIDEDIREFVLNH